MKRIRLQNQTYRLAVDPERLKLTNSIDSWILDILVKAGGSLPRIEMVKRFSKVVAKKRPNLTIRHTSLLSKHQRVLKDRGLITITDNKGKPIPTRPRTLVKSGQ